MKIYNDYGINHLLTEDAWMQLGDRRSTRRVSPDAYGNATATLATTAVNAAELLRLRISIRVASKSWGHLSANSRSHRSRAIRRHCRKSGPTEVPRYQFQSRALHHCLCDVPSANISSISNGASMLSETLGCAYHSMLWLRTWIAKSLPLAGW